MNDTNEKPRPANLKPGSLSEFVYDLGVKHGGRIPVQDMVDAINKRFPNNTYSRQTILALRHTHGIHERNGYGKDAASKTGAAPKRKSPVAPKKRKLGRPRKTIAAEPAAKPARSNGHAQPTDARAAFAALVRRIGTDAAEELLREAQSAS